MIARKLQHAKHLLNSGCTNRAGELLSQIMLEWCESPDGGPAPDSPLRSLSTSQPNEILFFLTLELEKANFYKARKPSPPLPSAESVEDDDFGFIIKQSSSIENQQLHYDFDEESDNSSTIIRPPIPSNAQGPTPPTCIPGASFSQMELELPIDENVFSEDETSLTEPDDNWEEFDDHFAGVSFEDGLSDINPNPDALDKTDSATDIEPAVFDTIDEDDALDALLDDDYFDDVGEGLDQSKHHELLEVESNEHIDLKEKAEVVAYKLAEEFGWERREEVNFLKELLNNRGWGQIAIVLKREFENGVSFEQLQIAREFKTIWKDRADWMLAFQKTGWVSELTYSGGRVLSWVDALKLIRSFPHGTTSDEIEFFVDQAFDYWMHNHSLRKRQNCFKKYLVILAEDRAYIGLPDSKDDFFYGSAGWYRNPLEANEFQDAEHLSYLKEFGLLPNFLWLDRLDHVVGAGDPEVMLDF